MQRIISILTVLFLCQNAYSQPFGDATSGYRVEKLYYENSSGEKGTSCFRYDKQNKLSKAYWSLNDKSRYSNNLYEHDSKGNLVSAFRDFSDGLTSFEKFEYDSVGNKIAEYFYRSDSIVGSAYYQYKNNRLTRSEFNNHKGWLNGSLKIEYDHKNNKKQGKLFRDKDFICLISYQYDSIGNLVKEHWDFNGKWSQTFRYAYKNETLPKRFYSSPYLLGKSKYRITQENYSFNNEIEGPSYYYYDENDLLVKKIFVRSDSLKTDTYCEYDTEGKLLASIRIYSDNTIGRFTYTYDENNNLITRNFFKSDTLNGFESYLYNDEGVLVKAFLKNFDGWLSGTIEYKTDEAGKIESGEFVGRDGFDAYIIFQYNQKGMLTKIRWDFSFGKFQEYNFEYEGVQ